jgi:hypothetical protein
MPHSLCAVMSSGSGGRPMKGFQFALAGIAALTLSMHLDARPITFANSTTVMAEYGEGVMQEAQVFYAPSHYLSLGFGHLELERQGDHGRHEVSYVRINVLARRWNLESAQANIFLWGGLGEASMTAPPAVVPDGGHDHGASPATPAHLSFRESSWNTGGQVDFETRRIYSSFKTDFHESENFWHRIDTLELGFAPYKHDVDTLATWLLVAGRLYSGNTHEESELAFLLRFFKKRVWVEAGATTEGEVRATAMISF